MQYAVKWGGLYTEEDMYGVASMKEKEVYADALAGISRANTRGTKKITSAVRKVFYKHTGLDIDALLADEQSTVAEAKQNEAQSTVAEPKAQAPPSNYEYSLDDYSAAQLDNWRNSKRIVIFKNGEQVVEFVKKAITDKSFVSKIYFGIVGEKLANRIKADTGYDFSGKNVALRADNIRKITKDHGNEIKERSRGQRAVMPNDYALIPQVIGEPDEIRKATYKNREAAIFVKNIDGSKISVVAVDSGGSLDLFVQTMYAGAKKESIANMANADALTTTPEATVGTAPIDKVSQTDTIVNKYSVDEDLPINLQLILNGDFDSKRNELHIGTTSNFLTEQIGAEALNLYMPAEKAYRAMATEGKAIRDGKPVGKNINYHGLGKDGLIEILNASENPIAAFADTPSKNNKRENRIVLVTDVKADGGLGVVIEEMDTKALSNDELIKANKAITVYPKGNVRSAIQEAMADNRILYLDEKRSQTHLAGMKGANYPTAARKADFSNNIRSFWDNVKWKNSGKTEMSFDSDVKTEPEWKTKLREYNAEGSYSIDDATAAEEEAQHRRAFQKAIESEGIEKLKERKATLEKIIGSYKISKGAKSMAKNRVRELESYTKDLECIEEELKKRAVERKEAAQLLEKQKELSDKLANYDGADDTLLETANELEAVNAELERRKGRTLQALNMRKVVIEGKMQYYNKLTELSSEQRAELVSLKNELSGINSEIQKKMKEAEQRKAGQKTAAEAATAAVDSLNRRRITEQSRRTLRQQLYDQYGILRWRKDIGATIDAFSEKWISKKRITKKDIESFEDALMQSGAIRVESAKPRPAWGVKLYEPAHYLIFRFHKEKTATGLPAAVSFFDVLYIPEVYRVCNAGLYYIHVRRKTFGDTASKKFKNFSVKKKHSEIFRVV